jgi:predicted methyltransferase
MSFHNQPQYPFETLQINGIKMHRVQESDHERAQIEKTKKCARAVLSESFRKWRTMIEYDGDMLRHVAIDLV